MKCLIMVDIQNDFIPGGSLPVPGGDRIIPAVNGIQGAFDLVVATQDWHPPEHLSFASNHPDRRPFETIILGDMEQTLWPDHCVQGSEGAAFPENLKTARIEAIFRKGMDPGIDSYSGFFDNGRLKNTGLAGYLREKGAKDLYFCGLAGDICVYFTVRDAVAEGFSSTLIVDAARPLDQEAYQKKILELRGMGVRVAGSEQMRP